MKDNKKSIDEILDTSLNGEDSDKEKRYRWSRYCRLLAYVAGGVCIYAIVEFVTNLLK